MPQQNQKNCWSIVKNIFSEVMSRRFLLGYLCISSEFLNFASAQNMTEETYFTYGVKTSHTEPQAVCIHSAPGCLLSARGIFSEGNRQGFEVSQLCSKDPDFIHHLDALHLKTQIANNRFYGTQLCNGILENKDPESYPIHSRILSDTDYQVEFPKEDRLKINYRPR